MGIEYRPVELRHIRYFSAQQLHIVQPPVAEVFMAQTVHDEAAFPFGGVKDSGNGREGGHWSMDELTETERITIQLGRRAYPF